MSASEYTNKKHSNALVNGEVFSDKGKHPLHQTIGKVLKRMSAPRGYVAQPIISATTTTIPPGSTIVSTFAGSSRGRVDGSGIAAQFTDITLMKTDSSGNFYVGDTPTLRKITPAGDVITLVGLGFGYLDDTGINARFNNIADTAIASNGNIFICDDTSIRMATPTGVVTTFAGSGLNRGYIDNVGASARFNNPAGIAIDLIGNLYVSDADNNCIRKITPARIVTTFAGSTGGFQNGTGTDAQFNNPSGIAIDSAGNLYVCDSRNNRIRKITPEGVVTTLAGSTQGFQNGTGTDAQFNNPIGIALDSAGNLYVCDYDNNRIRKITPGGLVTTIAGTGVAGYLDGLGVTSQFNKPHGITIDSAGSLYVSDYQNFKIRKITFS